MNDLYGYFMIILQIILLELTQMVNTKLIYFSFEYSGLSIPSILSKVFLLLEKGGIGNLYFPWQCDIRSSFP